MSQHYRPQERHVVKLRGLPWRAKERDVCQFFADDNIHPISVILTTLDDGIKASGNAYVEFATKYDLQRALGKHKDEMGDGRYRRYIEIFESTGSHLDNAVISESQKFRNSQNVNRYQNNQNNNQYKNYHNGDESEEKLYIIRIRGFPWDIKQSEIYEFFGKIPIGDIYILTERQNKKKLTGDGFIFLKNKIDQDNALELHKKRNNLRRYLELFRCNKYEFEEKLSNVGYIKYNNNENETKCLKVSGLPSNASDKNISDFLLKNVHDITPYRIYRNIKSNDAYIEFHSVEDCHCAYIKRNNSYFPSTRNTINLQKISYDKLANTLGLYL